MRYKIGQKIYKLIISKIDELRLDLWITENWSLHIGSNDATAYINCQTNDDEYKQCFCLVSIFFWVDLMIV